MRLSRRETVLRRERAAEVFCRASILSPVAVCLNKELLLCYRAKLNASGTVAEKVPFERVRFHVSDSLMCVSLLYSLHLFVLHTVGCSVVKMHLREFTAI